MDEERLEIKIARECVRLPEFEEMLKSEVHRLSVLEPVFTRQEMAAHFKCSIPKIDTMTQEEFNEAGFMKIKIGNLARFKRLQIEERI